MHLSSPARLALALVPALLLTAPGTKAQTPAPTSPAPTTRSLWLDGAALAKDRIRGGADLLAVGRITVGMTASFTHRMDTNPVLYPVPLNRGYGPDDRSVCVESSTGLGCVLSGLPNDVVPCYEPFSGPSRCGYYPYYPPPTRYRAWSLDLAVRYYPSALSFANNGTQMMVYVGEFAGYHWRTWEESVVYYYGARTGDVEGPYLSPRDTVIPPPRPDTVIIIDHPPYPYPILPWPNPIRRTLQGFQPGAEIGVRLVAFSRLFIEAGGRFTLVTIDDPWRRTRPGDVETRLVVAGGIAW